jgi:phosphoglycolate phosphatase-like HAD superfamily hydrolase
LLPAANLRRLAKLAELSVFTGRVRRELDYTLDRWNVRDFFQRIVSVENVKRPKPAPDGLLQILNGRDPSVALYLGDNVDDALAAKAAKMPFVGILPRRSEERRQRGALLRKLGALTILSDISELESLLKS